MTSWFRVGPMTHFAIQRVKATPEALELIESLVERHGPLAFRQSGQPPESASITCMTRGELLPADDDLKLGEIGGAPVYMEAKGFERCGRPAFVIDVAPGAGPRWSLGGLEKAHFVTRAGQVTDSGEPVGAR